MQSEHHCSGVCFASISIVNDDDDADKSDGDADDAGDADTDWELRWKELGLFKWTSKLM